MKKIWRKREREGEREGEGEKVEESRVCNLKILRYTDLNTMITFPFLECFPFDYSLRIFSPEFFQNILPRILPEHSQFEFGSVIRVTSKCDWIGEEGKS